MMPMILAKIAALAGRDEAGRDEAGRDEAGRDEAGGRAKRSPANASDGDAVAMANALARLMALHDKAASEIDATILEVEDIRSLLSAGKGGGVSGT